MPQLDINTFNCQYVGIIFLLIIVYTTLSYIVLPLLLRLMLIRNSFLLSQQRLSDVLLINSPISAQVLITKRPIYINYLLTSIVTSSMISINHLISLFEEATKNKKMMVKASTNSFLFFSESMLSYLILFLTIELNETNE